MGVWPAQDALQPMEALERERYPSALVGCARCRTPRREDRDDRRPTSMHTGRRPSLLPQRGHGRLIGHTKGGMYNKLHALCDSDGRPLDLFFTGGEVSDFVGARELRGSLSNVGWLLQDRSYDADWFGEA